MRGVCNNSYPELECERLARQRWNGTELWKFVSNAPPDHRFLFFVEEYKGKSPEIRFNDYFADDDGRFTDVFSFYNLLAVKKFDITAINEYNNVQALLDDFRSAATAYLRIAEYFIREMEL